MLNVRLAGDHLCGNSVHLAVVGGVFDGVLSCCLFSHEMSWMRSGTELSQFLRVFLPTLTSFRVSFAAGYIYSCDAFESTLTLFVVCRFKKEGKFQMFCHELNFRTGTNEIIQTTFRLFSQLLLFSVFYSTIRHFLFEVQFVKQHDMH